MEKKFLQIALAICLIVGPLAVDAAGQNFSGPKADIEAIGKLWDVYAHAVSTGDFPLWMSLWAEDAVRMPHMQPTQEGRESFKIRAEAHFAANDRRMKIRIQETVVLGDTAYSRGTYDTWEKVKAHNSSTMKYSGKFLDILKKQPDGGWKIAVDCYNSDSPPLPDKMP